MGKTALQVEAHNYTETDVINEAGRWRKRNVWYPGRPVRNALKEVTTAQGNKAVLNVQESAEVIVSRSANSAKDEGPNQ